ncbi:MAG: helix-turn-helix domain-containing protein [Eubacteriales bacterium]|nr:helix-turn-helix domain-containing protein [Eubacteriales bacterium]
MTNNSERIAISITEAAALLGISRTKAYELAKSEGFPSVTIGGRKLVNRRLLGVWLDRNTGGEFPDSDPAASSSFGRQHISAY